jgi:hypothetical protein
MPNSTWSLYADLIANIMNTLDAWADNLLAKEIVIQACANEIKRRKAKMYAEITGEDNE